MTDGTSDEMAMMMMMMIKTVFTIFTIMIILMTKKVFGFLIMFSSRIIKFLEFTNHALQSSDYLATFLP